MTPRTQSRRGGERGPRTPRLAALVALALASLVGLAFWADGGAGRGRAEPIAPIAPRAAAGAVASPPPREAYPAGEVAPARAPVDPAPTAAVAQAPRPERVRAAAEATARLDALRSYIVSSCWPARAAGKSAKLTFNLTFDAQGHEVARGIVEDRRAPVAVRDFGGCVRALGGTALAIAPPGANVGVSIPVAFP